MDNQLGDIERSLNEQLDLITTRDEVPSVSPDAYSKNLAEDLIITELSRLSADINSTIAIMNSYIRKDEVNPVNQRLESKQIIDTIKKLLMEQINSMSILARKLTNNNEVDDGEQWR